MFDDSDQEFLSKFILTQLVWILHPFGTARLVTKAQRALVKMDNLVPSYRLLFWVEFGMGTYLRLFYFDFSTK